MESVDKELKTLSISEQNYISTAIVLLLNSYPDLPVDKVIFGSINKDGGMAIYPMSGAVVLNEDICGNKECQYPFFILYRAMPTTSNQRINSKEFLDKIGEFLEESTYPELTGNRLIKSIARTSPSFGVAKYDDGSEDWQININLIYKIESEE